ncbi:Fam65c [Columba livia]|uniref:Family with sequence similarity 65, member C, transcript variant X1 n=2 Tax=Columba livia TaxID=8932 RepID=A0A2I0M601_COLLI|nr:protein FAM65C isoform X1 [Columba livia]XP_021139446.1 protein FAM65C isoform X1 [Columba livia]KAK2529031.1 Fam65c [Columba livia]PKK25096.1 family with sequence similarity 65, member C, transcript variant X5 [Columba livia]PKK25097.1 family with sequence similarity 65, member C, transcript variant X1 [Columba livia]PKK25099.1 family with sequence similarity 65, member C, transcript variant X3 [Columba livia]PKK25100.1 family with sequence similarity 65, member C, transcript variant X2 [
MSVKLTFVSPGDGGGISRSCSFTGFSTVQSRKLAKSLGRSSVRSRMSLKPPKAYNSLQKGAVVWDPKPLQVKKIFEALKKGLNEYLEAHQAELDYLSGRHKDTKRNSRLAFYYDLDKQIRSVERYIRKLEFHISKVEELYEAYCIQCRLRDGAANMKHAFSLSPSTKASRESLVELYKNFQECTEDMCFIEGALEVHLGEFHLKMKGLVGFARLCPGDQYEVFVRLGRQKWRLKGKIETDDSQTWDEEEKIFIPNLHEKFEIKVTELRGLATILVGVVTCDSINFFTTKPQSIVVDITELGTIKLQLEVLWNPFDTENLFLSPGSTAKFSVGSRKSSLYNWTPPNTPSFREKYYLSVLQQRQNQGDISDEAQTPSILSYLAACDFNVPGRNKTHNPAETSEADSFSSEDQKGTESRNTTPALDHRALPSVIIKESSAEEQQHPLPNHTTLDILKKTPCVDGFPNHPSSFLNRRKGSRDSFNQTRNRRLTEQEDISQKSSNAANSLKLDGCTKSIDKTLLEVLNLLKLHDVGKAQLEKLEYQVSSLRDKLKLKTLHHKHSSMESLMVETVLESFDFLNADCSADELSLFGSIRTASIGTYNDSTLQSPSCDTGTEARDVTTGDDNLDTLLITHLKLCKGLLQKLRSPNVAQVVQESILEEVSAQTRVLGDVLDMSVEEIIQKAKKKKHYLKIWSDLAEPGSILLASAERFRHALKYTLTLKVKEKYPRQLEAVLQRLLEQIVTCDGLLSSLCLQTEPVTLFQFYSYLEKHRIASLEKHLGKLAKEVMLIEELQCPGRLKTLKKLKGKRLNKLQPLPQTLRLLGILQLDDNHRVSKAATSVLARAAANRNLREKALFFYTDVLADCDSRLQQAACLALKNLRGVESIEQVAHLCQSEVEEVRNAARETTLSFGDKGRQAFEKMDRICCELRETVQQEAEIEITVF